MPNSPEDKVKQRLRALENPYAYADLQDPPEDAVADPGRVLSADQQISASRTLLQNPYAYLDDSGRYSLGARPTEDAVIPRSGKLRQTTQIPPTSRSAGAKEIRYSDREIEAKVTDLHKLMWKERLSIWGQAGPSDPIDVLDPAVALRRIGYHCDVDEGIGQYRVDGILLEVAGLIDPSAKTVRVSRQFPSSVQHFTMAHELGHAVLHAIRGGVHRDRPLDGGVRSRDPVELEADKFATYFLMPAKLVKSRFSELFRTDKLVLDEEAAFALAGASLRNLQQRYKTRRDLSRLLAGAERYNRQHFNSLASRFRVSIEAMAIRLEELSLV